MPRHKIAFCLKTAGIGGVEKYLLRLITYWRGKGYCGEIDVICKSGETGSLIKDFEEIDVNVIAQRLTYFNVITWWSFYDLLKKKQYSSICDFNGDFAGIPLMAAYLSGTPARITFYREMNNQFTPTLLRNIYWKISHYLTMHYATYILSNSVAALDYFCHNWQKDKKHKYEVIANGIDSAEFSNTPKSNSLKRELHIPENIFVIGHVGRFCNAKNHITILKVAEELLKIRTDLVFFLCGRGVPEALSAETKQRGLENHIILSSERTDIPAVLQLFDVFYFPSITEGQPNALLEAVISGIPFVASDIKSIAECFDKTWQTQLVPPDDIRRSVEALNRTLNDIGAIRKDMEQLKFFLIEKHAPTKCFEQVIKKLI